MAAVGRDRWVLGWSLGAAVVAVAGGLLTGITALARRVASQVATIEQQLDEVRRNTDFVADLPRLTAAFDAATRGAPPSADGSQPVPAGASGEQVTTEGGEEDR
jgi:hypothetical protein